MKIEFIKAHEDHTWDTEVINVPDDVTEGIPFTSPVWDSAIVAWCQEELSTQAQYRKVVYWGIYNSDPEQYEADDETA
jgi:hypothetical protein